MRSAYTVGIFIALLLMVGVASAITNPGFETGTLAGWSGAQVTAEGSAHGGSYSAHLAATGVGYAFLSQNIDLTNVNSIVVWYKSSAANNFAWIKISDGIGGYDNVYTFVDRGTWTQAIADLSWYSYTGVHEVQFYVSPPSYNLYVDDISLILGSDTPITGTVYGVTSKCVNLSATGAASPVWWEYGTVSGRYGWKTENVTAVGGIANSTECGTPLMSNTKFYFKACNQNGCGSEVSTTLAAVTPAPTTTFGKTAQNISVAHFDVSMMGGAIYEPYTWAAANADIVTGTILLFIFAGFWLRQRELILPVIIGLLGSSLLLYSGATSVGIPPEMLIVVVGLVSVAIAGIITGMLKR